MRNKAVAVLLFLLLFSSSAFAHQNDGSAEDALLAIQASQGAPSASQIDCNDVNEHQFEELGDALMEQMHPGEAHETMDAVMGGECSETLRDVHVSMGRSYLRCNGSRTGASMMQVMMGSGAMRSEMFRPLTGNEQLPHYAAFYADYASWIILILLIISIGLNAYFVLKNRGAGYEGKRKRHAR